MEKVCKFSSKDIKRIRLDLMLTQTEFAQLLGITFASVNKYENGKSIPALRIQRRLSKLIKKGNKHE